MGWCIFITGLVDGGNFAFVTGLLYVICCCLVFIFYFHVLIFSFHFSYLIFLCFLYIFIFGKKLSYYFLFVFNVRWCWSLGTFCLFYFFQLPKRFLKFTHPSLIHVIENLDQKKGEKEGLLNFSWKISGKKALGT